MPDEIIPRDRAELLWDAIINHTIEAVDAIRDRPELIAAAIAAGLPDMLGNPRDRYEMFLKAIAGAQGGGGEDYLFEISHITPTSERWNTPVFPAFSQGHELNFIFKCAVPGSEQNLLNMGQSNNISNPSNENAMGTFISADPDDGTKLSFRVISGTTLSTSVGGLDPDVEHTLKINDKIHLDGNEIAATPTRVYSGFGGGGKIMFGEKTGSLYTGYISKLTYK